MSRDLVIRFILGGVIVSLFSATGELWKPKTFSGIFGAAPSVALASLALTFERNGAAMVASLARSMLLGSLALFVYAAVCAWAARRRAWPVWLSALSAWLSWFGVAFVGLKAAAAALGSHG